MRRAATQDVAGRIRGLEQVGGFGGKAVALAEGQVYAADSAFYKKTLDAYAAATPAEIRTAMQQWLSRPSFNVRLEPGERPPYEEAKGPKKAKADMPSKKTVRPVPAAVKTGIHAPPVQRRQPSPIRNRPRASPMRSGSGSPLSLRRD